MVRKQPDEPGFESTSEPMHLCDNLGKRPNFESVSSSTRRDENAALKELW